MITLYQFRRTWGIPNQSQFCVKLETFLRINKIPYQIVETLPLKAPRGKLPFIIDENNHKISDSRLIVNHLRLKYPDLEQVKLSPEQNSIATAFQRLLEDHLYWAGMITRWDYSESNWQVTKQAIFGVLPPIILDVAAWIYRRKIKSQLLGHGMGRLNHDEVFELAKVDLESLALFLGNKPYFMGDEATSLDASAYGILVNILACPIESPLKEYALAQKNLYNFCRRMQNEFFPELPWPADTK